jgi:hypothetical protein
MKKTILLMLAAATLLAAPLAAQRHSGRVDTDIFGDLRYNATFGGYSATLKKNIFDDLTFSDSRRNEVVFKNKYLLSEFPEVLDDPRAREEFLQSVALRHRRDEGYRATFSVDIFGTVEIEDNRGNRTEVKTDIFGNRQYEQRRQGRTMSIGRDIHGTLRFSGPEGTASLGTAFSLGKWRYEDSRGNRVELCDETWEGFCAAAEGRNRCSCTSSTSTWWPTAERCVFTGFRSAARFTGRWSSRTSRCRTLLIGRCR